MLRAPPGPLVGAGRVRVDAARAVTKLRAFRLADPAAWILEAIRAAVAGGAEEIELVADSDELWLRWAGTAWSAEELAGLLDDLVSPEEEEHGYRRRLLGSAVNSALALEPRWLELLVAEVGGARGVRFAPDQVVPAGLPGEVMLRAPQPVVAPALPPLASGAPCAVQLHLSLATGLRTIWRAVRGQQLPELALARAACAELSVPMTIGGARVEARQDLLRLPLGQGLSGFVALVEPASEPATQPEPQLRVAELGVAIAQLEWPGARLVALPWLRGAPPPVRLYLDAPRVATNASRSAVDEHALPFHAAKERGHVLVGALVDLLSEQLLHAPSPRLRECAFALLAQAADDAEWSVAVARVAPPLRAVAAAPLLRNAVGELRPVAGHWERPVYRGARPLPQELAPWLETLAWIPPGDPAERLLRGADGHARVASEIIKRAQRARAVREGFLAQPALAARVTSPGEGVSFILGGEAPSSAVAEEVFAGLSGEVRVAAEGTVARLVLLYRGRLLETIVGESELSYEAVLDSSEVRPDPSCRAAERDAAFERVERAARLGAVRAVEQWCERELQEDVPASAGFAAVVRRALVLAATEHLRLPLDQALARAKVWPTAEGGWQSLVELRARPVVAVVDQRQLRVEVPPGALMLRADRAQAAALTALAAPTEIVTYGPFVALQPRDPVAAAARRHAARDAALTLLIREPHRVGAISPSPAGELALMHRGVVLRTVERPGSFLRCHVTVVSEELVPGASWRTVLAGEERATEGLERWERELARAMARALAGHEVAELIFSPARPATRAGEVAVLASALSQLSPMQLDELVGAELLTELAAAPLFTVSTRAEPVSARELREWFADRAIWYTTLEQAEELGSLCLVGEPEVARLASWLTRLPLSSVAAPSAEVRRGEQARLRLARHRALPVRELALPAESFPVRLPSPWRGFVGAALGRQRARIELAVWCEARPAFTLFVPSELPLVAVVELAPEAFNDSWTDLHPERRSVLLAALASGAQAWLAGMLHERPAALIAGEPARGLLEAWLEQHAPTGSSEELRSLLRTAPAWPTIQGGRGSLEAALHDGAVRTARWSEPWLAATEGAAAHSLDSPVLALPFSTSDRASWERIQLALGVTAHEVTGAVVKLQAARRVRHDGAALFAAALDEPTRRELFAAAAGAPAPGPEAGELSAGREALLQAGLLGSPAGPAAARSAAARGEEPLLGGEAAPTRPPAVAAPLVRIVGAAAGSAPTSHPLFALAVEVAERLRTLCGRVLAFARFVIVAERVAPAVQLSGDLLELAGQAPELARLARLLEREAAAAEPGLVALLAYLTSELNRAHTAVTDVHEQHILYELLRSAQRTSSSSTENSSVAPPGITPPAPRAP